MEPLLQVLVRSGHFQPPEKRQVHVNDDWRDAHDHHVAQEVHPVGAVNQRGDRHEGDGAELGAEDAQPCRPPRHPPPAQEEVVGTLHAARKVETHRHQRRQIHHQHRVVQQAEVGLRLLERCVVNLRRPPPRCALPANHDKTVGPLRHGARHARRAIRQLAPLDPRVRHRVIGEDVALKARVSTWIGMKQRTVHAACQQQMRLPGRHRRRGSRRQRIRQLGHCRPFPFAGGSGRVAVCVAQIGRHPGRLPRDIGRHPHAAEQEERTVQHAGHALHPLGTGPGLKLPPRPLACVMRKVQRPKGVQRLAGIRCLDATSDVDRIAQQRARHLRAGCRQRRQRRRLDLALVPLELVHVWVATPAIVSADADERVLVSNGNAVRQRPWQRLPSRLPTAVGLLEHVDRVVPGLLPAFPGPPLRKIGPAGGHQHAVAGAREHPGKPFRVRQRRKFHPFQPRPVRHRVGRRSRAGQGHCK